MQHLEVMYGMPPSRDQIIAQNRREGRRMHNLVVWIDVFIIVTIYIFIFVNAP